MWPDFVFPLERLSYCYYRIKSTSPEEKKDNLEKAKELLTKCITMDPIYSTAYFRKGCINIKLENYDEAIYDLKECERLKYFDLEAVLSKMATIYCKQAIDSIHKKEVERAAYHFQKSIDLKPDNCKIITYGLFMLKRDPERAEKLFSTALQILCRKKKYSEMIEKNILDVLKIPQVAALLSTKVQATTSYYFKKDAKNLDEDFQSKLDECTEMINKLRDCNIASKDSIEMCSLYFQLTVYRVEVANQMNITDRDTLQLIYNDCCFLIDKDDANIVNYENRLKYARLLKKFNSTINVTSDEETITKWKELRSPTFNTNQYLPWYHVQKLGSMVSKLFD